MKKTILTLSEDERLDRMIVMASEGGFFHRVSGGIGIIILLLIDIRYLLKEMIRRLDN